MKTNNVFIIGAGFDRAIFEKIALNDDLLEVLKRWGDKSIKNYFSKHGNQSIETVLTSLDLEIETSNGKERKELKQLRLKIENALVEYFQRFRFRENTVKPWMYEFAEKTLVKNDVIVNLNYSSALEGMLDACNIWSPKHGYSQYVNNFLVEMINNYPDNNNFKKIQVYKIHGSEHFHEKYFDAKVGSGTYIALEVNKSIFPKTAANSTFGAGMGPSKNNSKAAIIAPSFVKKPHAQLLCMMDELLERVRIADNLIVIGCKFRTEDVFLWSLLTAFILSNGKVKDKKVIIVDSKNAELIAGGIEKHFQAKVGNFFARKKIIRIATCISQSIERLNSAIKKPVIIEKQRSEYFQKRQAAKSYQ